jgi:hypothetical protein
LGSVQEEDDALGERQEKRRRSGKENDMGKGEESQTVRSQAVPRKDSCLPSDDGSQPAEPGLEDDGAASAAGPCASHAADVEEAKEREVVPTAGRSIACTCLG